VRSSDFTQPVALMLVAVLHFFPDADNPADVVAALLGPLPPGSYLVASHVTSDHHDDGTAAGGRAGGRAVRGPQTSLTGGTAGHPVRPRPGKAADSLRRVAPDGRAVPTLR
jgi:hypothetical protein